MLDQQKFLDGDEVSLAEYAKDLIGQDLSEADFLWLINLSETHVKHQIRFFAGYVLAFCSLPSSPCLQELLHFYLRQLSKPISEFDDICSIWLEGFANRLELLDIHTRTSFIGEVRTKLGEQSEEFTKFYQRELQYLADEISRLSRQ